jgi:hypothetical protein
MTVWLTAGQETHQPNRWSKNKQNLTNQPTNQPSNQPTNQLPNMYKKHFVG